MNSLYTLLGTSVDFAGLFPPARLSMTSAVQNYAAYVASDLSWMLGRFIVPVSRLGEFEQEAESILPGPGRPRWHLSALVGSEQDRELDVIREFNRRHSGSAAPGQAIIDTLELKARGRDDIKPADPSDPFVRYIEIPLGGDPEPLVQLIGSVRARAKMRTGGTSEEEFPRGEEVIRFMSTCIRYGIPYKATAGLHHPLRGRFRLSYEQSSPSGMMFGFLNIFLAGAFLADGMDPEKALRVLEEQAPDAFQIEDSGITWKGHYLDLDQLRKSRRMTTTSFGSCSFLEPVEELRNLGFMKAEI